MIPGVLPLCPSVTPLERISPSSFQTSIECKLKGAWNANRAPTLLPESPNTRLGRVVHKVIERIAQSPENSNFFERVWNEELSEQEAQMRSRWFETHLVPLAKMCTNFELVKKRCHLECDNIALTQDRSTVRPGVGATEREKWLQSQDGKIGGRIDAISRRNGETTIIDYKTGVWFDSREAASDGRLFPENNAQQLRMYAALFYLNEGIWPTSLELVALNRKVIRIPFTPEECLSLLRQARAILDDMNCAIRKGGNFLALQQRLASPSEQSCKYCRYKPACESYWVSKETSPEKPWPLDFRGTIEELADVYGGSFLRLRLNSTTNDFISIRGLNRKRHPALNFDEDGELIVLGLVRSRSSDTYFNQGAFTTLYFVPYQQLN